MKSILYILLPLMLLFGRSASAETHQADSLLAELYPILEVLENGGSETENFTKTDSLVNTAANLLVELLNEPLTDTIDFERYPAITRVTEATGGRAKIINLRYPGFDEYEEFFAPVIQWRDEIGQNHAARLYDSCKFSMMDRLGESNTYLTFCDTRNSERGPLRKIEGMLLAGQSIQTGLRVFADSIPVVVPIDFCGFFYNPDTDSFHFEEKECPDLHIVTNELGCDWKQAALRFNGQSFVAEKVK